MMKNKKKANVLLILSAIVIIITFFVILKAYSDGSQLATTTDLQKGNLSKGDQTLQWKQLHCGLWINKLGDIGFRDSKTKDKTIFIQNVTIPFSMPIWLVFIS